MVSGWPIIGAFILDSLIGDPQISLHPVRGIGKLAEFAENKMTRKRRSRLQGVIAWTLVVIGSSLPVLLLCWLGHQWGGVPALAVSGVIIYFSFALRDLNRHGRKVYQALKQENLEEARKNLSYMVSRQTDQMGQEEIIKTTLESLAENISDSVTAPLFYAALFGPIGAWGYRIINTLDAMWGYYTDRYVAFGFFAAKADDIVNYIPARLTAILISSMALLPGFSFNDSVRIILRDARKHHSPNSGYPEAAAAGALGVGFGGFANYFGTMQSNPQIGEGKAQLNDIIKMIFLNSLSSISLISIICIYKGVFS